MPSIKDSWRSPVRIAVLTILFALCPALAQIQTFSSWSEILRRVSENSALSLQDRTESLLELRESVNNWLSLRPAVDVKLPAPPPLPWSDDQVTVQIKDLQSAIAAIGQRDPNQPFRLGAVHVTVSGRLPSLSSMAQSIDESEIRNRNASTVAQAVDYLPGVAVQRVGPRNESGISIRGFDARESPLYVDGIPIYVPYDGYVDLNRFLTSDISEIQISKGYTSPLLGPNTLGGAVNLVTREPQRLVDADMAIGTGSGNALQSWLHLGSRWRNFYFLGSLDWLQSDFTPLSGEFVVNPLQPTDERANSYQRDEKFSGRISWAPRRGDQYVFTFINQKGEKGNPPYVGIDPLAKPRFWQWPYWNKTSYYFNSNTGIGESSYLKLRGFYDQYGNGLNAYDDDTYSTMTRPSSFISQYDDHTQGGAVEFGTSIVPRQAISASVFFKDDTHREHNLPNPFQIDRDQQTSFGFEDSINLLPKLHAMLGFSADHLNGLVAQDFQNGVISPFPTDHVWTYNPEASLAYTPTESDKIFAIYAKRSRFPTIKDRYSYRFGQALPNADLTAERADNWSLGYSHLFPHATLVQADLFRSNINGAIEAFYLRPNLFQLQNIGEEVYQGAEFVIRSAPLSRVTLDANYTFLNRASVAPAGLQLPGTPKHKAIGTATVRAPRNILLLTTARYESGRISQDDAGVFGPASRFATVDLGAVLPIKAGLDLQAGIKNLFDRNYFYVEGYPEFGRNWYFNVRYRF